MGRHSRPEPEPEQVRRRTGSATLLMALALVAAMIAVAVVVATRGDGDDQVTADLGTGAVLPSPDTTPALEPTGSAPAPSSAAPSGAAPTSTPTPTPPAPKPTAPKPLAPKPTVPKPTVPKPTAAPKPPPLLSFTVAAASWVSVTGPDGPIVGRVFPKGAKAAYDARELTVRTGNAGGVQFVVSGKKRRLGKTGQIEEFTVRKG